MKKPDLIKEATIKAGITQDTMSKALTGLIETISDELKKGGKISISGFGTFNLSKRKARVGVNPKTGAKIQLGESISPNFSFGETFKKDFKNK